MEFERKLLCLRAFILLVRNDVKEGIVNSRKRLYLDIGIKVADLIITLTVFSSAMTISVLITMILMIIPVRRKAHE